MRRGRTVLDSPEPQRNSQGGGRLSNANARRNEPPVIRDPLAHHLGNLVTMADTIAKYCTEAGEGLAEAHLDDEVEDLEEALETVLGQKDQLQSLRTLYRQSTDAMTSSNGSEERIKTIKADLRSVLEAPLNTAKRPELATFRRRVFEAGHPDDALPADLNNDMDIDDDADVVVAETRQSTICQLTQRPFEAPMKNPDCGHVYSQSAIVNMLRGSSAPCPIAGCSKHVRASNLVPDESMMLRLERSQNRIF